jgi:GH24 family phage-related lysozyme (muramidase)
MNKFSDQGCEFLGELEGCEFKAYKDTAKNWTIGIGHLIRLPKEKELLTKTLTKQEVFQLLRSDLSQAERTVNDHVKVPLQQNQYDALVIFVFNIGEPNFNTSTVLRLLNSGDYEGAEKHLDDWVKVTKNGKRVFSQGLQNRRDEEQELFDHSDYKKQR